MRDGQDDTGPAFPITTPQGRIELGMTYRQWLAGEIAPSIVANTRITDSAMKRCNDDHEARRKVAQSVWMLVDYLIAEEHTGWPGED